MAEHLISGYLSTASYGRAFHDEHDSVPSKMARIHHMRSVIQARLTVDDRFDLSTDYIEYGKVCFTDLDNGQEYVLRSSGSVAVEQHCVGSQYSLFHIPTTRARQLPQLLIYDFFQYGLNLAVSQSRRRPGKKRLLPTGDILTIGTWAFPDIDGPNGNGSFDQETRDSFDELGNFNFDEDGESTGDAL